MLSKKELKVIDYLSKQKSWVKSSDLSTYLNVSQRMIRKYIKNINDYGGEYLVLSSPEGYLLQRKDVDPTVEENEIDRPKYLVFHLLRQKEPKHISVFAEELYVSELTVKKDIQDLRSLLAGYDLKIKSTNGRYWIEGDEDNKRRLMSNILFEEAHGDSANDEILSQLVHILGLSFSDLKEIVDEVVKEQDVFWNELSVYNIYAHILVAMFRMKEQHVITLEFDENEIIDTKEYQIAQMITDKMKRYNVEFTLEEIYYLALILISNNFLIQPENNQSMQIENILGADYKRMTDQIVQDVYNHYLIDFSNDDFLIRFMIHLKNLHTRATYKRNLKNPLTDEIKHNYPFLYDISVYITSRLGDLMDITIDEGEISFIAIHLGAYLEGQSQAKNKIRTVVIAPNYQQINLLISKKLAEKFDDSLSIEKVYSSTIAKEVLPKSTELIVTTENLEWQTDLPIVKVKTFLTIKDMTEIQQEIRKISAQKKQTELRNYLDWYFPKELFYKNLNIQNKEELIHYLVSNLEKNDYVHADFEEAVIKREGLSSTAYGNVAMPHTLDTDSIKTRISVVLSKEPIKWDDSQVNIVCLIAVNKKDRKVFSPIFQALITVLSEVENVVELMKAVDYREFVDTLLLLMDNDSINIDF